MTLPLVGLIWAQSQGGTIGKDGVIPWHIPEDLARFREVTMGSPVIMGRKTWDSIPDRFRPLHGRENIVVTRQDGWVADGAQMASSIERAVELATDGATAAGTIWVIGGGEIYAAFIDSADILEVTQVRGDWDGETSAPHVDDGWRSTWSDPTDGWHTSRTGLEYRWLRYERLG
jgi:dihydrofolate reductase